MCTRTNTNLDESYKSSVSVCIKSVVKCPRLYTQALHGWRSFIFYVHLNELHVYNIFLMWKGKSYVVYNFSCICVYKRTDDGSQLKPKRGALNKMIKVVCDWLIHILVMDGLQNRHANILAWLLKMSHFSTWWRNWQNGQHKTLKNILYTHCLCFWYPLHAIPLRFGS